MKCQSCSAAATLFLCTNCTGDMRTELRDLATGPIVNRHITTGLLDALADVALRRTKCGSERHHRMRGDELPAPFEPDTEDGKSTVQGQAATLIATATHLLTDITTALHGPKRPDPTHTAAWLARHTHTIASHPDAGRWRTDIAAIWNTTHKLVDRPDPMRFIGLCPTWIENERRACAVTLRAREDQIEVHCRRCRTTHKSDRIRLLTNSDLRRSKVVWAQILKANTAMPDGYRVAERTLRDWRATGLLKIHAHTPDGEPLYRWSDVERLRAAKPQKTLTGAAAHRCRRP